MLRPATAAWIKSQASPSCISNGPEGSTRTSSFSFSNSQMVGAPPEATTHAGVMEQFMWMGWSPTGHQVGRGGGGDDALGSLARSGAVIG